MYFIFNWFLINDRSILIYVNNNASESEDQKEIHDKQIMW